MKPPSSSHEAVERLRDRIFATKVVHYVNHDDETIVLDGRKGFALVRDRRCATRIEVLAA